MPEKTLNDLPRDFRMLYEKGYEAFRRENFDYAIELFTQILTREPETFEVRKALRAAQSGKSGKKGGLFSRFTTGVSASPLVAKGQMALSKNPSEALLIGEQILNADANSPQGHKLVAEASQAMNMPSVAVMSLEILVGNAPKDKKLSFQLADALADSGHKTKAENVLEELRRQLPADSEITNKLKDLSARKTLDEGGYGALASGKGSYRDVLKNKAESVALEQEKRQVKSDDLSSTLTQEWEARLKTEPNNLKMLRNLAEEHARKNDFDKALGYYDRLMAVDGGSDASLHKAVADLKVKRFNLQLAQLDTAAPDHVERVAQVKADRQSFQLEECKLRTEKYPTDLQIRFEYGILLYDAGKIQEAMQEFQKAQNNPNRRIQSITFLAKCFERKGMFDMAARRLQEVLKDKLTFDEEKKDLIYTLGSVLEKMNKKEEAIEQFKLIYEVDMGYKDVSKKVDDYYAGGGTA